MTSLPHEITLFDELIVAGYLLFMVVVGIAFKGLSKSTSDYFRCGGMMPWWITGTSAWVATFSAWTFVGAASEVYKSGLKVLMLYYAAIPALIVVYLVTAVRFRRLRVVTWIEAVRERFGHGSEQFYTWVKVPIELVKAGVYLMSISVFIAAVIGVPVNTVIVVLGIIITIVAFAGGAFAVLASDFVQMFLVMTITVATMVLALKRPEVGGLHGLIAKVSVAHPGHFRWWLAWRPTILFGWGLSFAWVKIAELNSLEYSTMYLMPKSEAHAKRMVAIPIIGGALGPLIWVVPPLVATILFPNLAAVFPSLAKPTEGAFVATALTVLPVGLVGLLMCAMFGATLTFMDAALNKYVGVFVRSFYRPILAPNAAESHLLRVSKGCTLAFGTIVVGLSLLVNTHRQSDVFTLLNQFMVSVGIPLTIPVFFGLFIKRTPGWSAWVTALAAFSFSAWANFSLAHWIQEPGFVSEAPGLLRMFLGGDGRPLTPDEQSDLLLVVTVVGTSAVGIGTFLSSMLFYSKAGDVERARTNAFFAKLEEKVAPDTSEALSDEPVYRLLGRLCLLFGLFVAALAFIPNPASGKVCFVLIGGLIATVGGVLSAVASTKQRQIRKTLP